VGIFAMAVTSITIVVLVWDGLGQFRRFLHKLLKAESAKVVDMVVDGVIRMYFSWRSRIRNTSLESPAMLLQCRWILSAPDLGIGPGLFGMLDEMQSANGRKKVSQPKAWREELMGRVGLLCTISITLIINNTVSFFKNGSLCFLTLGLTLTHRVMDGCSSIIRPSIPRCDAELFEENF
jgi:hypothetical protein